MKAAVAVRYGGPEVLEIRDVPMPEVASDGVLVRVRAIGLNFADIFGRIGVYPGIPKPPFIPGLEFSGDVVAVGRAATQHHVGERVMGFSRIGSHAEFVSLSENFVVEIPSGMTYQDAAAFLVTGVTALHGLVQLAHLQRGERVLIHAAAGGVGLAALQIGKHIGAEIFATAGSEEKLSAARSFGADHAYNYVIEDFAREVMDRTGGYGVDVVLDSVGGSVFRKSWKILAQMGRYVILGVSAVNGRGALNYFRAARVILQMPPVLPHLLMSANKSLIGFNLGTLKGKEAYFQDCATDLIGMYNSGAFRAVVGKTFPFDQVIDAHRYVQGRHSVGKTVVLMDGSAS